jgi:hypothetical protein
VAAGRRVARLEIKLGGRQNRPGAFGERQAKFATVMSPVHRNRTITVNAGCGRAAVTFRGDQPDLGRRLRVEADLLEKSILPISVSDRALASIRPGEDRHLAGAVIVYPLNAPFFRVKPIRKDDCWLRHCGELLPHVEANAGADFSSPVHATHRAVDKLVDIAFPLPGDRGICAADSRVCLKNRQLSNASKSRVTAYKG